MPKKLTNLVTAAGAAASVSNATPMADGKSYIRNPKNPSQILQVQSKEGNVFKCFAVTSKEGTVVNVDSTKAIYVSENNDTMMEAI